MDCLFNFCGLVVVLYNLVFSPTIKSLAENPLIQKTTIKIRLNKKPVSRDVAKSSVSRVIINYRRVA